MAPTGPMWVSHAIALESRGRARPLRERNGCDESKQNGQGSRQCEVRTVQLAGTVTTGSAFLM